MTILCIEQDVVNLIFQGGLQDTQMYQPDILGLRGGLMIVLKVMEGGYIRTRQGTKRDAGNHILNT